MDTKNSERIVHRSGGRDLDRVSARGVVQRVTLVFLAVVALVATLAMPISAEDQGPWDIVPDFGGRDWFRTTYNANYFYTMPEMLYTFPIGYEATPNFNAVLDSLYPDWVALDRVNETFYLGSGFFGLWIQNEFQNPKGAFRADLTITFDLYGLDNTYGKSQGGTITLTATRHDGLRFEYGYNVKVDGLNSMGYLYSYTAHVRKVNGDGSSGGYWSVYDSGYDGNIYFAFNLEQTVKYDGPALANVNQFFPIFDSGIYSEIEKLVVFPEEYSQGYKVGYANGLQETCEDQYNDGYNAGLAKGEQLWQEDQNALIKFLVAVFTAPSYIINTLFDFDLFGFNLATIIRVLLTLVIVAVITKFALKSFGG